MKNKLSPILPGDKVGLVSPAGPVNKEQIQNGLDTLTQNNIQYEFGKHAFFNQGIVSASVNERIEDINHFLKRDDIKAIWALRGGYGSIQLLNKFDYNLLKNNPKFLIGFSDITALQWAVFKQAGLPSLSGLTITSQFNSDNPYLTMGVEILSGKRTDISEKDLQTNKIKVITAGEAEGILIGGTLSMICSLCGTSYFIDRDDIILFLEDVNEPLYRIDRYFQQLALMDFWLKVKGIILGQFKNEEKRLDIIPLIKPLVSDNIFLISNFPYGHQTNSFPLFQGVFSKIKVDPFSLKWENFIE
jgi:muramoyltetrapeptide carboxypeptidase